MNPIFVATVMAAAFVPLAAVWLLPLIVDVANVFASDASRCAPTESGSRSRFLVLVPAHDEAASIGSCVESIFAAVCGVDASVCVVADHCTDATARIAATAGADVLEWNIPGGSGKPKAIQFGLDRYAYEAYDAVVVIDADSVIDPSFFDVLSAHAPLGNVALQSMTVIGNESESSLAYLGAVLTRMRYGGQYPQKQRAGLNVPLMGNGMCLGTALLSRIGWPTETLTENWELYARCALHGEQIGIASKALLTTVEASTMAAGAVQRRRWQSGRAGVFTDYASRILASRDIAWRQKLDVLGELAAPGPVFQAAAIGIIVSALLLVPTPFSIAVAVCLLAALAHTVGWAAYALCAELDRRRVVRALAVLPVYALWRLKVMLPALRRRNRVWLRSPRETISQEWLTGEVAL